MKDPIPAPARRFIDQVVVVTGAAGGIGSATAERFAVEGAQVWVCDVSAEGAAEVAERVGGRPLAFDVASPQAATDAIATILEQSGKVDVLVNNAGINRRGPLLAVEAEDWDITLAVNVSSIFHLCKAVLPSMIEAGAGAIVNTASQAGLHPIAGSAAYSTSKAAVAHFTLNLARDYAAYGIRANAVCPGEISTPMLESRMRLRGQTKADLDRLVPYGRIGMPAEVAALIAFLASDEAPYLTGSCIEITGAQPAL
jgi:NAD(P)-dependent dehydrogenase (short-subunit alcohol dehydrogenase family)